MKKIFGFWLQTFIIAIFLIATVMHSCAEATAFPPQARETEEFRLQCEDQVDCYQKILNRLNEIASFGEAYLVFEMQAKEIFFWKALESKANSDGYMKVNQRKEGNRQFIRFELN